MTADQAKSLVKELVFATGAKVEKERVEYYIRKLLGIEYERGRLAVERLAKTAGPGKLPAISEITRAAESAYGEGVANAGVYYTGPPLRSWRDDPEAQFALWRQAKIERMPHDAYMEFLLDGASRVRTETAWRREYERELLVDAAGAVAR